MKPIVIENAELNEEQREMINRIERYDISFVFDKLLIDKVIERKDVTDLEEEFKKFVVLVGLKIFPLAMIGPQVDEVWHQFILFTRQYNDFCLNTVGFYIDHVPDTQKTPVPVLAGENLLMAYKKYFGEFKEIWFNGMNSATKKYYLAPQLIGKPPKLWSGWTGPEDL